MRRGIGARRGVSHFPLEFPAGEGGAVFGIMRNMKTDKSVCFRPFLAGVLFAALFVAASLAAAVPYRATDLLSIDYDGPIAEAKPVQRNCVEFTAPGGDTVSLYLGSSKNVPGWLSYKEGGAGATKHGPIPVGMVGFDPVAVALDDGRVVIAHVNPFEPDAKVYGFRMMAWIGPWASLKAGSTFGFYRVRYGRPNCRGSWLPDVKAADALYRRQLRSLATCGGEGLPTVAFDDYPSRIVAVNESQFYDAHPSSVMLPDEKTFYCFWDLAHGGPAGPTAKSVDGGLTWKRIDDVIPAEFRRLHDAPVAFRFVDPSTGMARIRVFPGYAEIGDGTRGPKDRPLAEAMPSIMSEDDGLSWKYMPPLGADFACVISFFGMMQRRDGSYLGVFHRGADANGDGSPLEVLSSVSRDGGLTWEKPRKVAKDAKYDLCEPAVFYSPDQSEICCLIRENKGGPSQMCFSKDDGLTWSKTEPAPEAIRGHRHVVQRLPDGRYLVVFRNLDFSYQHVYGWIGPYESIRDGSGRGGYLVLLVPNHGTPWDCGYQSVHLKQDGEIVVNTYSRYRPWANATPSIVSMRFRVEETDRMVEAEKRLWTAQLDAAENGTKPSPELLAKFASAQRRWDPFGAESRDRKLRVLTQATVYGFVKKGDNPLAQMAALPSKPVKAPNGAVDVAAATGADIAFVRPWFDPPLAAFVRWELDCPEDCRRFVRIKNDYYGHVFVNGERLPSAYGTDGRNSYRPFTGNLGYGIRFEATLKKGRNEIVLLTSPGSGGQWLSAAAVEE